MASYDFWGPANETNFKNNSHQAQTVDIRRLSLEDLPEDIDIVVGSPPCTQFSFSNRGGGGDIADGLVDIRKFFEIVDHLKPKFWAMENVPRVAKIIEDELSPKGALAEFRHLSCSTHLVDMSEYGLPQRRRRCIAGNFDIELLRAYRADASKRTLHDVISALEKDDVVDPIFGLKSPRSELTDHVEEDVLSAEEVRINRANKMNHTVYNAMPFPDSLHRAVRTITATCTRVSRESIIIRAPGEDEAYRRLTVRERASLQGFPITFQFYGTSYSQKLRMIGNAVPPAFSYLVAHALQGHRSKIVPRLEKAAQQLMRPKPEPTATPPDRVGAHYPLDRRFKFAIPSLQLKSGVRFELANHTSSKVVIWRVAFYFGTSKAIHALEMDQELKRALAKMMPSAMKASTGTILGGIVDFVRNADIAHMQSIWAHKGPGGTRPFMLLDKLNATGATLTAAMKPYEEVARLMIVNTVNEQFGSKAEALEGKAKLLRNAPMIAAGLLIGSAVNGMLEGHSSGAVRNKAR